MNKLFASCVFATGIFIASPAQAQSLTFQSQEKDAVTTDGTRTDGTTFGGRYSTGTADMTWADGKKVTETYKCMAVTMPPNDSTYNSRVICENSGAGGSSAVIWGCTTPDKTSKEVYCTGWAFGKSGSYAGRRGTMTFRGMGDKGVGTGQWGN
jgi:hypothetical protein